MRLYAILFGGFLGLIAVGMALAGPFLPGVKGLDRVQPGLWIDRTASAEQRVQVAARIAQAQRDAAAVLGPLRATPEWQVCVTQACDAALRLGPRGLTWYDKVIQIGSRGAGDGRFYLHETVHAELHNAAGLVGAANAALPNWLDEGMAVLISQTQGYPDAPGDCAAVAKIAPPITGADFNQLAGPKWETAPRAYRVVACATQSWLARGHHMAEIVPALRRGEILR